MDIWLEIILASVTAFAATNIDDIFILIIFFSERPPATPVSHIVIGQYLGFGALLLISGLGVLAGFMIPTAWIGLMGFFPIGIGIKKIFRPRTRDKHLPARVTSHLGWLGKVFSADTLGVASVTMANGGDNIGVYVPFFANYHALHIAVVVAIFLLMVGLWCFLGYKLSTHPMTASIVDRLGHYLVPVVLIGIGIYILHRSGAWSMLVSR